MKTFVGIDLGSTTTKAVLLDENSHVIGRGITNSRSNYGTAARVASEEARVDGRFTLFRRALNAGGGQSGELDEFLGALERAFRLEQFVEQLDDLEATCRGQVKGERFAGVESGVRDAIGEVFKHLREEAPSLYAPGAKRKSDFFRDIAGATTPRPRRSPAPRGYPMISCSMFTTSRSSKWRTARLPASSATSSVARSPACLPWTAWSGPDRPTCRKRS